MYARKSRCWNENLNIHRYKISKSLIYNVLLVQLPYDLNRNKKKTKQNNLKGAFSERENLIQKSLCVYNITGLCYFVCICMIVCIFKKLYGLIYIQGAPQYRPNFSQDDSWLNFKNLCINFYPKADMGSF